jgi:acyl-coenzyme A synthetase/AMP-(fatty) acid ligase
MAFTFGLGGLLAFPLRFGASTVLLEKHTPESLLQTIATYRVTQCYTAPTFYRQMAALARKFDLQSLRHPVSAGEALPDATRQLWKKQTGIDITDGIGGTEMIHIYISSAGAQVRAGSIGQVVPGYIAHIVDDHMQEVPPGTPGRLAVRGPTGCRYLNDARQTKYVKDGWNLPGDTFSMDRLTLNGSVRFDRATSSVDAITVAAHPVVPGVLPGVSAPEIKIAATAARPISTLRESRVTGGRSGRRRRSAERSRSRSGMDACPL